MKIYDDAHKLAKQIRESKEYREYKELKEKDASSIYIFRIGIFYNILNEDAKILKIYIEIGRAHV